MRWKWVHAIVAVQVLHERPERDRWSGDCDKLGGWPGGGIVTGPVMGM